MAPPTVLPNRDPSTLFNKGQTIEDESSVFTAYSDLFVPDLATQITALSAHPTNVQGHFCDLFTALHPIEGVVALKRPRISQRNQESTVVRRFLREANTWRAMQHPNVLRFLGACKIDGSIYLVSPYMRNGTIMALIRNHPERADRIRLIREIATALSYLHSQNVIHGDVKGTNILISDQEHALLCDFGLARMEDTNTSTTMRGVGTLRWQAPELWDDAPKSFKSDVYAFAMTIVEILSGDIPFRQYTGDLSVMRAVIDDDERPPMEPITSPEGVSYEWIWYTASMCWHTNPDERPAMSRVTWLLDCRPVSLVAPTVPHGNLPIRSIPTMSQAPTPFMAPRDPFRRLPPAVLSGVFCLFSLQELVAGGLVCRLWSFRINTDPAVWASKLREAGLWRSGIPEATWVGRCFKLRAKRTGSVTNQILSHPYKTLFKLRFTTRNRWMLNNPEAMRVHTLGNISLFNRVFLVLLRGRIVTAANDTISLHSPFDPENVQRIQGRGGDIRAVDICSRRRRTPTPPVESHIRHYPGAHYHDVLVSGYSGGAVRIWDLQTRKNTHTFTGHQQTVMCVVVARPVWVGVGDRSGVKEKWPKHNMLVSGGDDSTLVVWRVPGSNSTEYHGAAKDENMLDNPYYVRTLKGHIAGIMAIAVHGRIIASGSMDYTVKIWDLVTGECKHTLFGHVGFVASVALDSLRKRVFSWSVGSHDIRVWSLENGSALGVLVGPASGLTGQMSLSTDSLVSATQDENLVSWDLAHIDTSSRVFGNAGRDGMGHQYVRHDDDKIIHGCGQVLKISNARDGTPIRQMDTNGYVGRVAFDRRFCVALTTEFSWDSPSKLHLHIWDFAGDREANENHEVEDIGNVDPYDENGLAEEDAEFSDSEEEYE